MIESPKLLQQRLRLLVTLLLLAVAATQADFFDSVDTNSDGMIDKTEYQVGVQKLLTTLETMDTPPAAAAKSTNWTLVNIPKDGFWKGFTSSLCMILATEIGDKTFFIAAVLSMKHDRYLVFAGAFLALVVMTVLSTGMGLVLPAFLDPQYTHILSGLLFFYFGVKLIIDSTKLETGKVSEELEEVEEELLHQGSKKDEETGLSTRPAASTLQQSIFWTSLTLTFVAEWGDRSQIATIALASSKHPVGVTLGGLLGHAICTSAACIGGRLLASSISEKTVSLYGGLIFLLFGVHSLFFES